MQIRLAEAQMQKTPSQDLKPGQLDKLSKLEGWREELKLLENEKAEVGKSRNVWFISFLSTDDSVETRGAGVAIARSTGLPFSEIS